MSEKTQTYLSTRRLLRQSHALMRLLGDDVSDVPRKDVSGMQAAQGCGAQTGNLALIPDRCRLVICRPSRVSSDGDFFLLFEAAYNTLLSTRSNWCGCKADCHDTTASCTAINALVLVRTEHFGPQHHGTATMVSGEPVDCLLRLQHTSS